MRSLLAVAALGLAQTALAADGTWSASVGMSYTSGDYGTGTTTNILAVPFGLRYEKDLWLLKLNLPWYSVSGGASVVPGLGAVDSGNRRGRGGTTGSASGFGDASVSATYTALYDTASRFGMDLTGRLKLPTGDESQGLTTGSTDIGGQVDVYKSVGQTTFFGGLGYTVFSSGFLQMRNAVNYTLGGTYRFNARDTGGLSYDARTRIAGGFPAQRELTAYWAHALDQQWKLQTYLLKGFANGSPDFGLGASVLRAF